MHTKHQVTEEPWEGKLSRTGFETSATGDGRAEFNAAQLVGVRFQWAWDWIEQHQEAIASNLTEVK